MDYAPLIKKLILPDGRAPPTAAATSTRSAGARS